MSKKIPIFKGLPVLGNLLSYKKDRLSLLTKLSDASNGTFKIKIGNKEIIVITTPEDYEKLLQINTDSYIKVTSLDKLFGKSVATASHDEWKWQRVIFQSMFSSKYLEKSIKDIKETTRYIVDKANTKNLDKLFSELTFSIILKSKVGLDFKSDFSEFDKSLRYISNYLTSEKYQLFKLPRFLDSSTVKYNQATKYINDIIYKAINDHDGSDTDSFIGKLLEVQKTESRMTHKLMRDNIMTMIFAGYDTSSSTLVFLCTQLAANPQWQNKCRSEAEAIDYDNISMKDFKTVPNLEACINETIRLFPVGWAFTRTCIFDNELENVSISKGEIVMFSPFLTHRSSKYWRNPTTYNPQRFLDGELSQGHKYKFIPFGAGPRKCVGMQFAIMEIKIIMTYLLQNYHLDPTDTVMELDARVTLFSQSGYPVKLRPIKA